MESQKDQRVETRLSSSQSDAIDKIIASLGTKFKLTRSDVVRSFIEQGIENYKRTHSLENMSYREEVTLGERLGIFFTMLKGTPEINHSTNIYKHLNISAYSFISSIYKNKMFWFFELSSDCVNKLYRVDDIRVVNDLLNTNSNPTVCDEFIRIINIITMFRNINDLLSPEKYREYEDDNKIIAIKSLCERNNIPLEFRGFPKENMRLVEMSAVISCGYADSGSIYINGVVAEEDFTKIYTLMHEIYDNIVRQKDRMTLEELHKIVEELSVITRSQK